MKIYTQINTCLLVLIENINKIKRLERMKRKENVKRRKNTLTIERN